MQPKTSIFIARLSLLFFIFCFLPSLVRYYAEDGINMNYDYGIETFVHGPLL